MLPDPLDLRCTASVLATLAEGVRAHCTLLSASVRQVRWAAPLVDDVRRQLAAAIAAGLTGSLALEAGAAHLRGLARAVEDLRTSTARLHAAAEDDLRGQLAAAPAGPGSDALHRALGQLPGPGDPTWARLAGLAPVALPDVLAVRPEPVLPSPPGRVEAELDGVRRVARLAVRTAAVAAAAGDSTRTRTAGLELALLDPYGLAGSRSAIWFAGLSGPASPLGRAAAGWAEAARTSGLLAGLLEAADSGAGLLLADPRLPLAVAALAALRTGSDALQRLVGDLPLAEVAWLADVVPGMAGPTSPAPARPWWLGGPIDWADWSHSMWQLPSDLAEDAQARVDECLRKARDLRLAARDLGGDAAEASRQAARDAITAARPLRERARGLQVLARFAHLPAWLRPLVRPIADVPVLRVLSRFGAVVTLVGIAGDVQGGTSVPMALSKAGAAIAATVAVDALGTAALGALVGLTVVTAPAWLTVAGAVLVFAATAAAAMAASALMERYGPVAWAGAQRAGRRLLDGGRTTADLLGRAGSAARSKLSRAASARLAKLSHATSDVGSAVTRKASDVKAKASRTGRAAADRLSKLWRPPANMPGLLRSAESAH